MSKSRRSRAPAGAPASAPTRQSAGDAQSLMGNAALAEQKVGDTDVQPEQMVGDDDQDWWRAYVTDSESDSVTLGDLWGDVLWSTVDSDEEINGPEPEIDTPAEDVDTPAPSVDTPTSDVDTPTSDVDTPSPDVDTPSPDVDSPTPVVDTPTPSVDTPTPEIEVDEDVVDVIIDEETDVDSDVVDTEIDGPAITDPAEVLDVVEDVVVAAEEAPKDLAHRPDSVGVGDYGALIAMGGKIELQNGPGADASVTGPIANGTAVVVIGKENGFIEVEYNAGGKKATGWVSSAVFSDQPRLFHDDDDKSMMEGHTWTHTGEDESDVESGRDVEQGGLADCYFIAGMNAVGNANSAFLDESVVFNESTGMYKVRFFEEQGYNWQTGEKDHKEIWIEVDGYLPTKGDSKNGAYASGASGKDQWGAIIEKAYAVWKGGYNVMGDGGYGSEAMTALTGNPAQYQNTSQLSEEEVIPFFTKAEEQGLAIYTGSLSSMELEVSNPLTGSDGKYSGTVPMIHNWNHLMPGTVSITDAKGNVGSARDTGSDGDKTADFSGSDVADGEVEYKSNKVQIEYAEGKAPESGGDLEVRGEFQGMLDPAKQVIAWHGYSFDKIVDGMVQLYNPWGSWQPKPLTPAEYLKYYSSLSTCQVPQAESQS